MNKPMPDRNAEVSEKLAKMRRWLLAAQAGAIRLRGVDWFSWATAGGSDVVLLSAETGGAELLVTAQHAYVLTDEIEAQRLQDEEVPAGWEWHVTPWAEPELRDRFVSDVAAGAAVISDRPGSGEQALPSICRAERLVLTASEQQRYREVGQLAASAMSEVMQAARPGWSECELAGAGAEALWGRGLHPVLTLAAGARRLPKYRHPTPTAAQLGDEAMLVFCARGFGLVASLTRFVEFAARSPQQRKQQAALRAIEAAGLQACRAGQPLSGVYHAFEQAYRSEGFPQAIREHHQGGIAGYLAREVIATPASQQLLTNGMALAFNPSLPGVKIEDTFLLQAGHLENLTLDPAWPTAIEHGRLRPLPLEAA
jgi:Xaa-Pro aminopeptidase